MNNAGNSNFVQTGSVYINRHPNCKYFSYVRTAFGILTVFGLSFQHTRSSNSCLALFSSALDSLFSLSVPVAVYLFLIDIPVFLLEFGRIIRTCCGTDGALCRPFSLVLNFDRWQRGLLYAVVSVPCFFPSISNTSSKVAGICLFVCGCLYVAKSFQVFYSYSITFWLFPEAEGECIYRRSNWRGNDEFGVSISRVSVNLTILPVIPVIHLTSHQSLNIYHLQATDSSMYK